jgi:hypothetical protein
MKNGAPVPSGNSLLIGYINHSLSLSPVAQGGSYKGIDSHSNRGKKRPRPIEARTSQTEETKSSECSIVGLYFVPLRVPVQNTTECSRSALSDAEESAKLNSSEVGNPYQLVVPHSLLQVACDAVRYGSLVKLVSYSRIRTCTSNAYDIIEVHTDGIHSEKLQGVTKPSFQKEAVMSLKQIQEMETRMDGSKRRHKKGCKKNVSYSFSGTVDAVSPIINAFTDPFALMEMYDSNENEISAVVIFKGRDALKCHLGVQPGHELTLLNVCRNRWHVPQSLWKKAATRYLYNRVPTHVFVVTDPLCIIFSSRENKHDEKNGAKDLMPPLPSTVKSLTSIQGTVKSIQYGAEGLLHAAFIHDPNQVQVCKLYFRNYPISPELYHGIKEGSVLRAVNIHLIISPYPIPHEKAEVKKSRKFQCFGACLRSTITILSCASADTTIHPTTTMSAALDQNHTLSPHRFYNLSRFPFSLREMEWLSYIRKDWFDECKNDSFPAFSELKRAFLRILRKHPRDDGDIKESRRNPYEEFFGYASENDMNGGDRALNSNVLDSDCGMKCGDDHATNYLPIIISPSHLRELCLNDLTRLLSIAIKTNLENTASGTSIIKGFDAGWTSAFHYNINSLHQLLYENIDSSPEIFIAGTMRESVDNTENAFYLADGSCQIMCYSPARNRAESMEGYERVHDTNFSILKVRKVIVSCICVGHVTDDDLITRKANTVCLSLNNDEVKSSCSILHVYEHCFCIIIQLHVKSEFLPQTKFKEKLSNSAEVRKPVSIQKYLFDRDNVIRGRTSESVLVGRLARSRWKPIHNITGSTYSGLTITLSHVPSEYTRPSPPTISMNSIDVKINIEINLDRLKIVENGIIEVLGCNREDAEHKRIKPSVSVLACVWWTIADNPRLSSILLGGWNDIVTDLVSPNRRRNLESTDAIHVVLPYPPSKNSTLEYSISTLRSYTYDYHHEKNEPSETSHLDIQSTAKTFIGERTIPPGLRNRNSASLPEANKMLVQSLNYIPVSCIAHLQNVLHKVPPQLVYRIPNARLLTITFCRAKVQCTRCYKFLGKLQSKCETECQRTLQPMRTTSCSKSNNELSNLNCEFRSMTCPNNCDTRHAAVKWELSGVIQDGTGLAKLYAENELALMLLSKDLNLMAVEKGAWETSEGITYQMAVPIKDSVERAIYDAKAQANPKKGINGVNAILYKDVLPFLSHQARAEYELYQFCLESKAYSRALDFLVRKKKAKKDKDILNHLEISSISKIGTSTLKSIHSSLALPTVGLKLVHCVHRPDTLTDLGWDLVQSLQR